jgi:hypothetical protein
VKDVPCSVVRDAGDARMRKLDMAALRKAADEAA